jgi:hypothetical protein
MIPSGTPSTSRRWGGGRPRQGVRTAADLRGQRAPSDLDHVAKGNIDSYGLTRVLK